MPRVNILELNAALAVAAHRGFRAAAAELGMSPSALSHAIAQLEARMGVRLFNRTTRSVAPSQTGEEFLARIRPALGEIVEAMRDAKATRDTPSGLLRINAAEGTARRVLGPLVLEFLARYPDMQVELVTEGRLVDIVAEGFDAGVRLEELVPRDMIALPCGPPQRFVVVAAPAYLAGRTPPRSPADLGSHACIRRRFASGAIYRWEFEHGGEALSIDVKGPLTLDIEALMAEAARAGLGLAYVREHEVAGDIAAGRLVGLLEDWLPPASRMCLYYPGRRHVPAGLRAFATLVRRHSARA